MSSWWQKYRGLTPQTRLLIGVGVMGYAGLGLLLSDTAEERLDLVPTEQDKENLKKMMPRLVTVDRDDDMSPRRKPGQ